MFHKYLAETPVITANDGCRLRELVHPQRDPVALPYSLAWAEVPAGGRTLAHRLAQAELYLVVSGRARLHAGDEELELGPGDVGLVPPGAVQWLEVPGTAPCVFCCIVSPPWQAADDQRV